MTPDVWCHPNTLMTATTLSDAKKECSDDPNCHMFYDRYGLGNTFKSCSETSNIEKSSSNSILYQYQGNKPSTKFHCFRDIFGRVLLLKKLSIFCSQRYSISPFMDLLAMKQSP